MPFTRRVIKEFGPGRVVWSGDSATLSGQPELLHKYVGL